MRLLRGLLLAGGVMHASIVVAQAPFSALAGRVVRAGPMTPIAGADVRLAPGPQRVVTDALGAFRFDRVTPGRYFVVVRRLGFVPDSLAFDVPLANGASVIIPLREAPQPLDTVSVTGRDELLARGKLAGFYERKKFGIGRFLEEKDIEKMLTRRLADILVAKVPGVRAARSRRAGSAAYIATVRLMPRALVGAPASGSTPAGGAFSRAPRMTTCYPDVYLDGVVVYSSGSEDGADMGAESVLFDVNSIDAAHVSAIEFYGGPAQMPAQFNRTGSACGALLIWTK